MACDDLEVHYRHTLEALRKAEGVIGVIFRKAQNKIQDPAKLKWLIVDLIDKENWSALDTDLKGDAYEGLLQKNAEALDQLKELEATCNRRLAPRIFTPDRQDTPWTPAPPPFACASHAFATR